jgi:hypothetical protein
MVAHKQPIRRWDIELTALAGYDDGFEIQALPRGLDKVGSWLSQHLSAMCSAMHIFRA